MEYFIIYLIGAAIGGVIGSAIGNLGAKENGVIGAVLGCLLGPLGWLIVAVLPKNAQNTPEKSATSLGLKSERDERIARLERELADLRKPGRSTNSEDDGGIPTYKL